MTNWYEIENAKEIPSPALLVYPDRIESNLNAMIGWTNDASRLRPHVKTHKMPDVVAMKLSVGITKFKASTIAEVEMTAEAGGRDVLLAYQPVGPNCQRVAQLAAAYPDLKLATVLDNPRSLRELAVAAQSANVTIHAYIDLDIGMHRTGIAPTQEALQLYRSFSSHPGILPGGIHAYDGHLHQSNYEELGRLAKLTFAPVWSFKEQLASSGHAVPSVVVSGTPTSMLLAHEPDVEVSAGTPVLWDSGYTELCPQYDFKKAAVLLVRVISKPTSDTMCVDLGYKAVASESPQPRAYFFGLEDAKPVMHSEEHLVVKTERASEYCVGDVLYAIPHHICPTVALYQEAACVRLGRAVESWPITARNRRLTI